MTETVRVYDSDPYRTEITATVKACLPVRGGMLVLTDRTCFFPGGGGQDPDSGAVNGVPVKSVREEKGEIWLEVGGTFSVGEEVLLAVDPEKRRDDVEIHTGEHILSGTALRLFGVKNVGFHIGSDFATADFDRELTREEIERLEEEVNRLIRQNSPVRVLYPPRDELSSLSLRKMPETDEEIRVVLIEGADSCACCGTHARFTGEVGILRIFSETRLRGGSRLFFLCGRKALKASAEETALLSEAAELYSTAKEKLPSILRKRLDEEKELKIEKARLLKEAAELWMEKLFAGGENHVEATLSCDFSLLREIALCVAQREGASALLKNERNYALVKNPSSGTDLKAIQETLREQGASGGGRGDFYSGKLK